ncbi:MAG: type VI secretion system baseplate subunit TssK, partial [Rhodothermales bacterium]
MTRAHETRAYDLPDAIAWHEGMMLAPQHFQQLTRRQEALLHFHAMTMAPHHWGVRVLNVDRVLLVRGLLRMLDLEAILPDGLVLTHIARQGSADLEVDLTPHAEALKEGALTVHLAVAGYAGPSRNGALERYESYPSTAVVDETTGEQS